MGFGAMLQEISLSALPPVLSIQKKFVAFASRAVAVYVPTSVPKLDLLRNT